MKYTWILPDYFNCEIHYITFLDLHMNLSDLPVLIHRVQYYTESSQLTVDFQERLDLLQLHAGIHWAPDSDPSFH